MAVVLRAATPILMVIAIAVLVIPLGLVCGCVVLVWICGVGDTEIRLLEVSA
jgi:hypothetical protein